MLSHSLLPLGLVRPALGNCRRWNVSLARKTGRVSMTNEIPQSREQPKICIIPPTVKFLNQIPCYLRVEEASDPEARWASPRQPAGKLVVPSGKARKPQSKRCRHPRNFVATIAENPLMRYSSIVDGIDCGHQVLRNNHFSPNSLE